MVDESSSAVATDETGSVESDTLRWWCCEDGSASDLGLPAAAWWSCGDAMGGGKGSAHGQARGVVVEEEVEEVEDELSRTMPAQ